MQEWVSIYEINECDIRTPDIHRFPQVDGLSMGPTEIGVSHYRYCPVGQRIRVTHHYVRRSIAHLTLIGIPIYP